MEACPVLVFRISVSIYLFNNLLIYLFIYISKDFSVLFLTKLHEKDRIKTFAFLAF